MNFLDLNVAQLGIRYDKNYSAIHTSELLRYKHKSENNYRGKKFLDLTIKYKNLLMPLN